MIMFNYKGQFPTTENIFYPKKRKFSFFKSIAINRIILLESPYDRKNLFPKKENSPPLKYILSKRLQLKNY